MISMEHSTVPGPLHPHIGRVGRGEKGGRPRELLWLLDSPSKTALPPVVFRSSSLKCPTTISLCYSNLPSGVQFGTNFLYSLLILTNLNPHDTAPAFFFKGGTIIGLRLSKQNNYSLLIPQSVGHQLL